MNKLWFWLIILPFLLSGQPATGQRTEIPFKVGEQASYGAYYNLKFVWIQSGEVAFKADTLHYMNQKAWHLKAVGRSLKAYDLLYTVRDTFETFCEFETFKPIYSCRILNHARDNSVHQYWFDYRSGTISTKIKQDNQAIYQANLPIQENTFDLLATAYNFRKFDFSKLFVGEKVPYRMLIDRQLAKLYFRYLGIENVKHEMAKNSDVTKFQYIYCRAIFFLKVNT